MLRKKEKGNNGTMGNYYTFIDAIVLLEFKIK